MFQNSPMVDVNHMNGSVGDVKNVMILRTTIAGTVKRKCNDFKS